MNNAVKRIFLVEDDEALRETFAMLLEEFADEVLKFSSLEELEQYETPPSCEPQVFYLIDHNLPGGNGLDFIEQQINSGKCQCVGKCMAIMSGALTVSEMKRAEKCGCYIFEKPIMLEDFQEWFESVDN